MATGTEVLVARLFWGLGYHVPETHLATLRPEELTIDDQARITSPSGNRRRFKESDIRLLLRRAHRESDGSYRVVASRALEGRPVGGFRFYGTRSDDPNDVIPHEHRRELRGYGTFSAWLNHVDSKSINTLDTVVEQDGKQVVRHHLLDFGSTIGSAGVYPREAYEGWEYLAEGKKTLAGMPSLGLYVKNWRTIPLYRAKSVGAFPIDNTQWDPERWKPRYANSAFRSARLDDKFWAARRLQAFTDEMLNTLIGVGRFNDPKSEEMLSKFLIERRNAILRRYLPAVNPVVDVRLSPSGTLTFRNAAVDADVAHAPDRVRRGRGSGSTMRPARRRTSARPARRRRTSMRRRICLRQRARISASRSPPTAGRRAGRNPHTPTSGARRLAGRWLASSVCRAAIRREARAPAAGLTDVIRRVQLRRDLAVARKVQAARRRRPTRTKGGKMSRKIAYWGATGLVGIVTLCAAFSYLTAAPEAVENFRHVGYPQQLRVLLGIGKLAGAIVLLLPRLPTLEGMGLRRLYLHVDRGSRGALSGGRRKVLVAGRVARVAGGFVRHAPGESPRLPASRGGRHRAGLRDGGTAASTSRILRTRATNEEGHRRRERDVETAISRPAGQGRRGHERRQLRLLAGSRPASSTRSA